MLKWFASGFSVYLRIMSLRRWMCCLFCASPTYSLQNFHVYHIAGLAGGCGSDHEGSAGGCAEDGGA